jgi:HEAT repeat protein
MNQGGNFQQWATANLSPDVMSLTRIKCIFEICDTVDALDGPFAEEIIIRVLEQDPDPIVRHEAGFALFKLYERGVISGDRAVQALCRSALEDTSTVVHHEAAESLGFFRHPQSFQTLQGLLQDPNIDVSATARISLERLNDEKVHG